MSDAADGWLRVVLEVAPEAADPLADLLTSLGAASVTFMDSADMAILEPAPGATPLWQRTRVVALFDPATDPDALAAVLTREPAAPGLGGAEFSRVPDRDWERAWLDRFRPMAFGGGLWVVPSGTEAPADAACVVRLDPGLAFGTGTHPTTALCLEWLGGADLRGTRVLDYGCGSGILAVAAALLGAREVLAVDHDPQALTATRDNATRNGVRDRVTPYPPEALPAGTVDVVLANILAEPLVALAPELCGRLGNGGRAVLSGLLAGQEAAVTAAYLPDCRVDWRREREGWLALGLGRGPA